MTSHQTSSTIINSQRQRERERIQRERASGNASTGTSPHTHPMMSCSPMMAESSPAAGLFAQPIKHHREDETTKKIKSTLGEFEQVQRMLLNDHKPLIGISNREVARINGSKAKVEAIFSEMRLKTLKPLEEDDEDEVDHSNDSRSHNNIINTSSSMAGKLNSSSRARDQPPSVENELSNSSEDMMSDDDSNNSHSLNRKAFHRSFPPSSSKNIGINSQASESRGSNLSPTSKTNHKVSSRHASDGGVNESSMSQKTRRRRKSSAASASSSSSEEGEDSSSDSSNSSGSGSSSDEDDVDGHHKRGPEVEDAVDSRREGDGLKPEISSWNLISFMDRSNASNNNKNRGQSSSKSSVDDDNSIDTPSPAEVMDTIDVSVKDSQSNVLRNSVSKIIEQVVRGVPSPELSSASDDEEGELKDKRTGLRKPSLDESSQASSSSSHASLSSHDKKSPLRHSSQAPVIPSKKRKTLNSASDSPFRPIQDNVGHPSSPTSSPVRKHFKSSSGNEVISPLRASSSHKIYSQVTPSSQPTHYNSICHSQRTASKPRSSFIPDKTIRSSSKTDEGNSNSSSSGSSSSSSDSSSSSSSDDSESDDDSLLPSPDSGNQARDNEEDEDNHVGHGVRVEDEKTNNNNHHKKMRGGQDDINSSHNHKRKERRKDSQDKDIEVSDEEETEANIQKRRERNESKTWKRLDMDSVASSKTNSPSSGKTTGHKKRSSSKERFSGSSSSSKENNYRETSSQKTNCTNGNASSSLTPSEIICSIRFDRLKKQPLSLAAKKLMPVVSGQSSSLTVKSESPRTVSSTIKQENKSQKSSPQVTKESDPKTGSNSNKIACQEKKTDAFSDALAAAAQLPSRREPKSRNRDHQTSSSSSKFNKESDSFHSTTSSSKTSRDIGSVKRSDHSRSDSLRTEKKSSGSRSSSPSRTHSVTSSSQRKQPQDAISCSATKTTSSSSSTPDKSSSSLSLNKRALDSKSMASTSSAKTSCDKILPVVVVSKTEESASPAPSLSSSTGGPPSVDSGLNSSIGLNTTPAKNNSLINKRGDGIPRDASISNFIRPIFLPEDESSPSSSSSGASQTPNEYYNHFGKKLKHAADRETNRVLQLSKYLEAVLFFSLSGHCMEQQQQQVSLRVALDIYRDTLNLLKCVTSAFKRSQKSETGDGIPANDHKLIALSYRCQSLLTLKMSRLRGKELRDNHKVIQANSPDVPAAKEVTLPVAVYATMKKQLALYAEQSSSLDLWSSAEFLIQKYPSCKAFFRTIDLETGSLSLSSSFDELVTYVRTALRIIH